MPWCLWSRRTLGRMWCEVAPRVEVDGFPFLDLLSFFSPIDTHMSFVAFPSISICIITSLSYLISFSSTLEIALLSLRPKLVQQTYIVASNHSLVLQILSLHHHIYTIHPSYTQEREVPARPASRLIRTHVLVTGFFRDSDFYVCRRMPWNLPSGLKVEIMCSSLPALNDTCEEFLCHVKCADNQHR
jgi:hypothetical protein